MKTTSLLGMAMCIAHFINAATITVTNTNDNGAGTLRQAVSDAYNGDTINFSLSYPATIILTSGQIVVNKTLTILGPSSDLLTIDGNNSSRIFYWGGNWSFVYEVNISGISFTNGQTIDVGVGCEAGAGIRYENNGTINISNCNFINNHSHCNGGAIDLNGGGMVARISECIFQNNNGAGTGAGGGAIVANIDSLFILNSTFEQNQFPSSTGGAVAISSSYSQIINSTFYNNQALKGSAISYFVMNDVNGEINSCTFNSNTLSEAIYIRDYFMLFSPCTFSLTNNILDNNINFASALSSGQVTVNSLGNNISSDSTLISIFTQIGDLNNTDPQLEPSGLQNNGGNIPTIALMCNSPAKDAGSTNYAPLTDQRGFSRYGIPDIGAYEINIQSTITLSACKTYTAPSGNETYTTSGVYFDTIPTMEGCDSVITIDLTINDVSDITTTTSGISITANNASAIYKWLDCDNNYAEIPGQTSQSFIATVNGNYAVELTENGCVDTSACVSFITNGIIQNGFGGSLKVYPNPTNGDFFIDLGYIYEKSLVSIFDVNGRLVESKTLSQSQILQLAIKEPAGIFIVSVQAGDKKAVIRMVKE